MLPIPQTLQKCIGVLTGSPRCEKRNEQGGWSCLSSQSVVPADTSYSSLDSTLSGTAWKNRRFVMLKPKKPCLDMPYLCSLLITNLSAETLKPAR